MKFVRTASGLNNFRLFKRVQYVVFTEGGSVQYDATSALSGSYNAKSIDGPFWASIIKLYKPNTKFSIKPVGSKVTLLEILSKVQNSSKNTVLVAADRDFEGCGKREFNSKRYICTWGYSWENCLYNESSITSLIFDFFLHDPSKQRVALTRIKSEWKFFRKYAKRLAKIDSAAIQIYGCGYFDRQKEGRDMFVGSTSKVCLNNVKRRKQALRTAFPNTPLYVPSNVKNPLRYCYGKFISAFSRRLIREIMDLKVSDEIIDRFLMPHFIDMLQNGGSKINNRYYMKNISRWMV